MQWLTEMSTEKFHQDWTNFNLVLYAQADPQDYSAMSDTWLTVGCGVTAEQSPEGSQVLQVFSAVHCSFAAR